MVRGRTDLGRQLRKREADATAHARAGFENAAHRADLLLQHEPAAFGGAVAQGEQDRRPDRRMAGELQLPHRRENPHPRAVTGVGGCEDEHRLGMIELAGNRLHGRRVDPLGVEHDRERIAGEPPVGENVERCEPPAHDISLRMILPDKAGLVRDHAGPES